MAQLQQGRAFANTDAHADSVTELRIRNHLSLSLIMSSIPSFLHKTLLKYSFTQYGYMKGKFSQTNTLAVISRLLRHTIACVFYCIKSYFCLKPGGLLCKATISTVTVKLMSNN